MNYNANIKRFMLTALLALSLISLLKCNAANQVGDSTSDLSGSDIISDSIQDSTSIELNANITTLEIAFRQVSKFRIQKEFIIFCFFGVVSEPFKKGDNISFQTNLTKKDDDEIMEQEANCTVKEDVNPENGELKQVDFECQVNVEKPEQYDGLEVIPSESITGIPSEPKLLNPAIVDELIQLGEIKDYSLPKNKEEPILVLNETSLDTNDSETTGVFYIEGVIPPKFKLIKNLDFELTLLTGQKVICTIPKIKPDKKEIRIECVLEEEANNTKITISPCAAFDGYNEVIRFNRIEDKEPKDIPNGRDIKLKNKFNVDLSFGQLCGFAPRTNFIFFYFVGFITKPLKKGHSIKMMVNLLKNGLPEEQEANCTISGDVNPKGQSLAQFDCQVEDVEKPAEFEGLELVSSEEISGIPTNPELLNPAKVDELIKEGNIENYTSPEFQKEEIPVFNPTSLDTNDSEKTGIFYINSAVPAIFKSKKKIQFEVILLSGEKAICTLPKISKSKKEVKIECVLQKVLKGVKIYIQSFAAFEGYKQFMRFNKIESEKKVIAANGREKKFEKLSNIDLLFAQLSGFKFNPAKKEIIFKLIGYITKPINKDDEIKLDVKLKTQKNNTDDEDEGDDDDEDKDDNAEEEEEEEEEDEDDEDDEDEDEDGNDEEDEVICKAKKDVKPNGKQKKVEFECTLTDIDPIQVFIGIEIFASEEITGIPADKKLRNPAKVDKLIKKGKIKDYTANENEEVDIPLFNSTSVDTTDSFKTGIFFINGLVPPKFVLKKKLNLMLCY
jgi:hypothetical protein